MTEKKPVVLLLLLVQVRFSIDSNIKFMTKLNTIVETFQIFRTRATSTAVEELAPLLDTFLPDYFKTQSFVLKVNIPGILMIDRHNLNLYFPLFGPSNKTLCKTHCPEALENQVEQKPPQFSFLLQLSFQFFAVKNSHRGMSRLRPECWEALLWSIFLATPVSPPPPPPQFIRDSYHKYAAVTNDVTKRIERQASHLWFNAICSKNFSYEAFEPISRVPPRRRPREIPRRATSPKMPKDLKLLNAAHWTWPIVSKWPTEP